jgi:dihydropteroate synthase
VLHLKFNVRVVAATNLAPVRNEMSLAGEPAAAPLDFPMADTLAVALENLPQPLAETLRQLALAAGGDATVTACGSGADAAATARAAGAGTRGLLLTGPRSAIDALLARLATSGADLREVGAEIRSTLDAWARRRFVVAMGDRRLAVGPRPALVGILNVTPDSFSDGGRFLAPRDAVARAEQLVADGAAVIDVGGESTRPGSDPVSDEEELARVLPVIRELAAHVDIPISIDTRHARVAREAVAAGACLVNDITGLLGDAEMARTVADSGAGVVIMHILGEPKTMQHHPHYDHLMADVCRRLRLGVERAADAGVPEDRILVDPGIGFGKTLDHNLEILARLGQLRSLGQPIMVGPSRKRFIGELTGQETPEDRTFGTAAACAMAVAAGALLVRVHDVRPVRDAMAVASAIVMAGEGAP